MWAGLLVPPLAWGGHLVLGDLIFELGCAPGMDRPAIFGLSLEAWSALQTAVMALATVVSGLLAGRAWGQLRHERDGTALQRARALAMAGIASSLLYLLIILFGLVPGFFFHTSCGTSP